MAYVASFGALGNPSNDPVHRLFDGRAERLGPYYISFGAEAVSKSPSDAFRFGLDEHARWVRWGDANARERFLARAEWAALAQKTSAGVRGSYAFARGDEAYGCSRGFRSAAAQGEAISLMLRAYEETHDERYLERAADAAVPLCVEVCDGGVMCRKGDDVFFEEAAGTLPSHLLFGWISALWALFELTRTPNGEHLDGLYRQSLATLEKYLPCYDAGSWSYANLLAAPSGFRRFASARRHAFHVAQLDVLISMTKSELITVVAERWRRYARSLDSRFRVLVNAAASLPNVVLSDALTVPGGARSVV